MEPRPHADDLQAAARQRAHPRRRGAAGRLPRRLRRHHRAGVPEPRPHRPRAAPGRQADDQHRPPPGQPVLRRGQLGGLRGAGRGRDGLPPGPGAQGDAGAGDGELPLSDPGDRHRRLPLLERHRRRLRGRGLPGARGGPPGAGLPVALREPAAGGGQADRRDAPDAADPRRRPDRHRPPDAARCSSAPGPRRATPRG